MFALTLAVRLEQQPFRRVVQQFESRLLASVSAFSADNSAKCLTWPEVTDHRTIDTTAWVLAHCDRFEC
jgi:hypothetical protein